MTFLKFRISYFKSQKTVLSLFRVSCKRPCYILDWKVCVLLRARFNKLGGIHITTTFDVAVIFLSECNIEHLLVRGRHNNNKVEHCFATIKIISAPSKYTSLRVDFIFRIVIKQVINSAKVILEDPANPKTPIYVNLHL